MTAIGITGMGLTGVVRMTWVQDDLAHVLEHARVFQAAITAYQAADPMRGREVVGGSPGRLVASLVGELRSAGVLARCRAEPVFAR